MLGRWPKQKVGLVLVMNPIEHEHDYDNGIDRAGLARKVAALQQAAS
jgi:hypothetical protein